MNHEYRCIPIKIEEKRQNILINRMAYNVTRSHASLHSSYIVKQCLTIIL